MRHTAAVAMAAALAASVAGTPAMSWGVVTKWWNANVKDTKFSRGISSSECWKSETSFGIYKTDNEDCYY